MGEIYLKRRWMCLWNMFYLALLVEIKLEGISAQIRYSIQEELKIGAVVGNIAKDLGLDLGRLSERNLRILSGTKQDRFQVNQGDGALLVNHRVDREELCGKGVPCLITLKAVTENPLEMHQVTVEVIDVNDNFPKFPEENYTLEILESVAVGARFQVEGAHDPDVGLNALQSYKLNHNQYFRLETEEFGEDGKVPFLILQRPLDREHIAQHLLLLTAIDGGKPPKSGTINITVVVSDINDNSPVCDKQKYTITIRENAPTGTFLLRINASDSDEGVNGEIEYSLRSKFRELTSEPFDLDSRTGKLTVKSGLDFEEKQVYEIKVLAADKGAVSLSTHCNVIVRVQDVNDNPPEIDVTSISSQIPEDAPPGTVVALIEVTDIDSGVNGQVVCNVPGNLPFDLKQSPDGHSYSLITKDYLDKESVHMYDIKITAKDLGSPALSSTKVIKVDVLDMNDNSPLFIGIPYAFYVLENNKPGMPIFSVSASDADDGDNAEITYALDRRSSGPSVTSFLNINEANGTIYALKKFDFETLQTFQFFVATDSGTPPLSSNVTVNVFMLDQNDNAPVILYPVNTNGSAEGVEEIPRNVNAGQMVTKVRAYDADIGYNGWLLFSLQEVTDHSVFGLDRYTGQIRTLRSFTETDEAEHKLVILVKDNGNVSLSATATVIVKAVEPKEAFAASDVKSAPTDDEETNVTFYLVITLSSVSALFIISIIVLIAMQCSKPTNYSSKYLQDANYDGTLCHSIQYRSGDKRYMLVGPRMSIGSTIVPGSNGNTLVVPDRRRTSGEVSSSFDEIANLTTGAGGQRRRMEYWWLALRLFVLLYCFDQVSAQIKYSIPEEVKVGSVVGNVAKDLGLEIALLKDRRFRIVSGSNDGLFEVNQNNGVLFVHKNIDREEICDSNAPCSINLKIVVENPLEIHYVSVEITDVNDNSPSFQEEEKLLEISESTVPGKRFQLPIARDPDVVANTVRLYKLNHNEHFNMQIRERGEDKIPFLVLQKSLDREKESVHKLILTAVDGGIPPRSGTLNVTVTVLDSNDNTPMFSQEVYSVTLPENVEIGTIVLKVKATDEDDGANGDIEYYFGSELEPHIYDIFSLDKLTGEIRVKGHIDFENVDVYKLDVHATDTGQPPMSTDCRVIIKVLDLNDNKPEIEVTSLSNMLSEDSKPGTVVSLISITDQDAGINGKVICSLSENVPFELKPSFQDNMYSLVTKQSLDRESVSHYDITIIATDCGQPPLSTFRSLSIQVSDVNDNSPEFMHNPIELYLLENNTPGKSIFSVSASDKDLNENAAISYHMVKGGRSQGDMASFLNINSDNGHISALKSFDFETLKTFQFQVVAADSGTPPLSSNVTVNVFILDQNDNAPVILYPVNTNGSAEGVEEIPRNVNAGHLVTKVRAYDADIGYNGWLLFSLQEVTDHSLFGLDRYTGQIRTLRSFTETDEAEHKLVILVKDNGNVSLSATATVIVKAVEPKEAFAASDVKSAAQDNEENNLAFYLMITLGSVSALFIISFIVLIVMQCSKPRDYSSKYLQDVNYDGTLCHSIQYRSGDKRYMLVGPRMSIGSTIVPGSNGNTLVVPDRRRTSGEVSANEQHLEIAEQTTLGKRFQIQAARDPDLGRHSVKFQDTFSVRLQENAALGTVVIRVNATDLDEGSNSDLEYSLDRNLKSKVYELFDLDSLTGEIRVKGKVDFEDTDVYRLDVQVSDKGQPPLTEECRAIIKIIDVNDNEPEIEVTSLSSVVAENSKPGTVISLISVTDKDSGLNGKVICSLSENVPFELKPSFQDNMYSLVTKQSLDRELLSHYDITITATDCGQPPLSTVKTLSIQISDVNDNSPKFSQSPIELYLVENNPPGASICSVSASDNDLNENAAISYHIVRGDGLQSDMTSFLNINSENGQIFALKRLDYETLKTFRFQVVATDSGTPSLSSNVTVNVFILDQNDNAPVILYPVNTNGSAEGVEEIPRNVNAGHLVTKVRAYDADIGYNGWLLYSLQEVTDHSLFGLDRYTGQIRTLRSFTETDEAEHKLVILVKDNGNVSLSATATVIVKVVEPKEAFAASDVKGTTKDDEDNNLTFYLMITLGSVSALFLISIIVLIVMQCSKPRDYSSKYLQDANYDGTLCHSIQYRSGDKRYMLVGPRMSIGSTIVPGSNGNTLVVPDRRRTSGEDV
ncbi:uncharacterized protein ACJ7VT_006145 [Polymixia lowei]